MIRIRSTCPCCGRKTDEAQAVDEKALKWLTWHCADLACRTEWPVTELDVVRERSTTARDTQVAGKHYKEMGVEPWDVIDTWPLEQRIGFYRGGALKYIMRMGHKDQSAQEIAKGKHYMEKLLEVLSDV